ncbi:hypothetical protein ABK040_006509 [Willaertia magna]
MLSNKNNVEIVEDIEETPVRSRKNRYREVLKDITNVTSNNNSFKATVTLKRKSINSPIVIKEKKEIIQESLISKESEEETIIRKRRKKTVPSRSSIKSIDISSDDEEINKLNDIIEIVDTPKEKKVKSVSLSTNSKVEDSKKLKETKLTTKRKTTKSNVKKKEFTIISDDEEDSETSINSDKEDSNFSLSENEESSNNSDSDSDFLPVNKKKNTKISKKSKKTKATKSKVTKSKAVNKRKKEIMSDISESEEDKSFMEDERVKEILKKRKKSRQPVKKEDLHSYGDGWYFDALNNEYTLEVNGDPFAFVLDATIFEKLYAHQQIGVKWLAERYLDDSMNGGLLADEMGLGKTIQIATFINGIVNSKKAKKFFIISPASVVKNWEKELKVWTTCSIIVFHGFGSNKQKRKQLIKEFIDEADKKGAVLLTTFQTATNHMEYLKNQFDEDMLDCVCVDEGHKIKNKNAKCSIALRELASKSRFALTGTPILNRLKELWSIYDWIFKGELLGTLNEFNSAYTIPINRSTKRDATPTEKREGNAIADELRELIKKYFLQRHKNSVLVVDNQLEKKGNGKTCNKIAQKNDLVVWCKLSKEQKSWYEHYLKSEEVKRVLNKSENPLVGITVLKNISNHPIQCKGYKEAVKIRNKQEREKNRMELDNSEDENEEEEDDELIRTDEEDDEQPINYEDECGVDDFIDNSDDGETTNKKKKQNKGLGALLLDEDEKKKRARLRKLKKLEEEKILQQIMEEPIESLISLSCKTQVVLKLVQKAKEEGQKTLIFSQFTRTLNIIQRILKHYNITFSRIDGSVSKGRQELVDKFNEDKKIDCFLLTTQAGGVGLTLTGASRVIIVDPSFSPANDDQAADRAYRIGQKKNVIVYRLMTCGTIEEYIYGRQISKNTISRTATVTSNQYRYFSSNELVEMFTLKDTTFSETCQRLNNVHSGDRVMAPGLTEHIKFIETINEVYGVSDNDCLFKQEADDQLAEIEEEKRQSQNKRISRLRNMELLRHLEPYLTQQGLSMPSASVDATHSNPTYIEVEETNETNPIVL